MSLYRDVHELSGHQLLFIFYETNDVLHKQEIPILNIWGFISSCGGSLGLFLGFSINTTIFSILDFVIKMVSKDKKEEVIVNLKLDNESMNE